MNHLMDFFGGQLMLVYPLSSTQAPYSLHSSHSLGISSLPLPVTHYSKVNGTLHEEYVTCQCLPSFTNPLHCFMVQLNQSLAPLHSRNVFDVQYSCGLGRPLICESYFQVLVLPFFYSANSCFLFFLCMTRMCVLRTIHVGEVDLLIYEVSGG